MSDADVNVDNDHARRAGAQMLQRRAHVGLVNTKNIRGRRAGVGHERRRQQRREDVGPGEALMARVELWDRRDRGGTVRDRRHINAVDEDASFCQHRADHA